MLKVDTSIRVLVLMGTLLAAAAFAQTPAAGNLAPDFRLQDQDGQWHTLGEYRGKWLALYFYPKDNSPHCTTEACEFRDNIFAFKQAGAVIVGTSVDSVDSHKKFETDQQLPFTLLADPSKQTAKAYGVLKRYLGVIELAQRETFLIDPKGVIVKHYADVDPKKHSQEVLGDIKRFAG